MSTLYILQLEDDKWYIGKTDDVQKRFEQHKSGRGSAWTKVYKPIKIAETRAISSAHDETNVTKDYMKKYGVDNVRGGAYCQVDMSDELMKTIKHEINSGADKCYSCGLKGHFANKCPSNKPVTKEVWGCNYCDREFETKFGATVHERSCKTKNVTTTKQSGTCFRCGRPGHYSPECYAYTHTNGQYLGRPPYDPRYDSDSD